MTEEYFWKYLERFKDLLTQCPHYVKNIAVVSDHVWRFDYTSKRYEVYKDEWARCMGVSRQFILDDYVVEECC